MDKNILVTGANGQLGRSIQKIRAISNYEQSLVLKNQTMSSLPEGEQLRNSKPETRNQKPETRNQKPETRNQKPETGKTIAKPVERQYFFTDIDTLDIYDKQQLADCIHCNAIGTILNCAAYTAVDKAEDDRENCLRINRDAVQHMGEVTTATNVKVIHVSTDYVFDGASTRPYREDDPTNPQSFYGQSKLEGEMALQQVCPEAVIIRTSWLYSEYGANFVKTMLRLGKERTDIHVVNDQKGSPTYAEDLAVAMMVIAEHQPTLSGIYHYANEGVCSWYDFTVQIMTLAGLACRVHPIPTTAYPTRAIRPAYSVLDTTKIKSTYNISIPKWEDSLEKCLMTALTLQ